VPSRERRHEARGTEPETRPRKAFVARVSGLGVSRIPLSSRNSSPSATRISTHPRSMTHRHGVVECEPLARSSLESKTLRGR
jgi:hypothetical protein